MPTLTSPRGLEWAYDIRGEGESLLFLHGFAVSRRLWAAQAEHFSTGYQVIAPDLPGHGQSGWMDVGLTDMAQDIAWLLDRLDVQQVNVIASSFGGLIALTLYKVCPEKLQRVCFVGSLPKFARTTDYPAGLDIERIRKLSSQFAEDYEAMVEIFFRSLFSRQDRNGERFQWIRQFHKNDSVPRRDALQKFLSILEAEDLRDLLSRLQYRVQFITGTEDYICPMTIMHWLEATVPQARFDYLKGVGHFPFLTKPQEFNRLLEDFLIS